MLTTVGLGVHGVLFILVRCFLLGGFGTTLLGPYVLCSFVYSFVCWAWGAFGPIVGFNKFYK